MPIIEGVVVKTEEPAIEGEGVVVKIEEKEKSNKEFVSNLVAFLKELSQHQSPEEICESLVMHIKSNQAPKKAIKIPRMEIDDNGDDDQVPQRRNKWMRMISSEEQKVKFEEQKFIAKEFCEHGQNYNLIIKHFPKMSPKSYRCYVQAVNNQNINDIIDFLRYQCNVQIQKLNRDQKRSMRTQLTKIREWLGNRDLDQLQTYYRFIHRHYNKSIQISYEDAIKLYKTIIQIIKSPYVNVLEVDEEEHQDQENDEQTKATATSDEEEKAVILEYIKSKDLAKVSDSLCQSYGYHLKWSIHSVRQMLKQLLIKACNKLASCLKRLKKTDCKDFFSEDRINLLLEKEAGGGLKAKLLSYLLQKRTNYNKVNEIVDLIKAFYLSEEPNEEIELPKLQVSLAKEQHRQDGQILIKIEAKQEDDTEVELPVLKDEAEKKEQNCEK